MICYRPFKLLSSVGLLRSVIPFNYSSNINNNLRSKSMGKPLTEVVTQLQTIAPLKLAESWDNVGLLVEPTPDLQISSVLLTIDLTEDVVEEAIDLRTELIISYHPNIFRPLKNITQSSWKERIITKCIRNNIAVFSPHTSWDAMESGVNDWLASALKAKSSKPILVNPEDSSIGMGRKIVLESPVTLRKAIEDVKAHIGINQVRVGLAKHKDLDSHISTVALCAGSGASVLNGVEADLYLTGEMLHHDVLKQLRKAYMSSYATTVIRNEAILSGSRQYSKLMTSKLSFPKWTEIALQHIESNKIFVI